MDIDLFEELKLIVELLNEAGVEYALCGGLAVAVHGYPRATQDIDLLLQESDLDRLTPLLGKVGYTLPSGFIPVGVGKDSESKIFRISKVIGEDFVSLDLLIVSSEMKKVWESRSVYELDDFLVSVVSISGLKQMKKNAGRPQDLADIASLEGLESGNET